MKYEVLVGNIGTVYVGNVRKEALRTFREYRRQSLLGTGRAGHESVTLFDDTEPAEEFNTDESNRVLTSDGKELGFFTGLWRRCRLEGCTGRCRQVRWTPDGRITWPCSKGLVEYEGRLYIGPIADSVFCKHGIDPMHCEACDGK